MVVVNRSRYVMNSIVCDGLNIFNTTSCVIVIIHKMHLCGYNSLIEKEVSILGSVLLHTAEVFWLLVV